MIVTLPDGLTVKALKKILEGWPEEDDNGEPTTVWIETGKDLSSEVNKVYTLNFGDLYLVVDRQINTKPPKKIKWKTDPFDTGSFGGADWPPGAV